MGKKIDLTGQRFGKMVVIKRSGKTDSGRNTYWKCICDCGKEKDISMVALKRGQNSCGCASYESLKEKTIGNEFCFLDELTISVRLRTGEQMLCDLSDWETLKKYTWTKDAWGYASASVNKKRRKFHTMILEEKEGFVIDHKDRNKLNNKRNNLRYLTKSGNAINSKVSKNNTSGHKGVCKTKTGKWTAQIMLNRKHIHLGTYDTIEEAIEARREGEEKYFKPIIG